MLVVPGPTSREVWPDSASTGAPPVGTVPAVITPPEAPPGSFPVPRRAADRPRALRVRATTQPATPGAPNEDWMLATEDLVVVLDGQTARTGTGCAHGVAWYAATLGGAIADLAADPALSLDAVLSRAIDRTAGAHPACDLRHPATPSATAAIVRPQRDAIEYLVLGDVTVLAETSDRLLVVTDARVDAAARAERHAADRHPLGSPQKRAALLRMKHAELALRNRPGGYWVAAADPAAARHAVMGAIPREAVRRLAVLSDGAARVVALFGLTGWPGVLDLLRRHGPAALIDRVRAAEAGDPAGTRWPRNKGSDDATAVYAELDDTVHRRRAPVRGRQG